MDQEAPDDAVVAYAIAQGRILVTHDRGCARRSLAADRPHLWLRTPEPQDQDRLYAAVDEVVERFASGAIRVLLFLSTVRVDR
jgi:predicted nuclease of predicted toxin-antitoxin system